MTDNYWDGENWLSVFKNDNTIKYFFNNELHRNDGPAVIEYFENGSIEKEFYYKNSSLHRDDGPAIIFYYTKKLKISEEYFKNDKRHRDDGPAIIFICNDGSNIIEEYWFNNIKFDPEELPFDLPLETEEKEFMFNLKHGDTND